MKQSLFTSLPLLIGLPGAVEALRPMGYEDIVTMAKPQKAVISPSGNKIAYTVRKGHIEENCNRDELHFYDVQTKKSKKIFVVDEIFQIEWEQDGKVLYVLTQDKDQYHIVIADDSGLSSLASFDEHVSMIALGPNSQNIYYAIAQMTPDEEIKEKEEKGYTYIWGTDCLKALDGNHFKKIESDEIRRLDLNSGQSHFVTKIPRNGLYKEIDYYIPVEGIVPSADERMVAFTLLKEGRSDKGELAASRKIKIWDSAQQQWKSLSIGVYKTIMQPCWISNVQLLFIEFSSDQSHFWSYDVQTEEYKKVDGAVIPHIVTKLFFDKEKDQLFAQTRTSLYRVFLEHNKVEKVSIPEEYLKNERTFDRKGRYVASITESSNTPPEIAMYDLSKGRSISVTKLNPQLSNFSLGKVEKIDFAYRESSSVTGYLVHPTHKQKGKQHPLIVATYGFHGGFITDAEWHSTFPAQTLAAQGYYILLLNRPPLGQGLTDDPERARQLEGWDVLHLFEHAVDYLIERKNVNPNQVGIYGWSHGGFIAEFLIAHSKKFRAASLGEGGDHNPGVFWALGMTIVPQTYENMFGGPPWGDTLTNYLGFSPFFHVEKIEAPLMLEFSESAMLGLEMYVPLKYLEKPAELVFYKGEEHNFVKPKARIASMARKVDWFNYWLLDTKDPDPQKEEQYRRWDEMRK